jgi:sugar transferase (PEP-CTERM/EpsH1 system associated)
VRIAYLCHRIPYPPDKGEKIRAFHQLQALSDKHEVDLFTLIDDPADLNSEEALNGFCRNVTVARIRPIWARVRSLPYLATALPLTVPYFGTSALKTALRRVTRARTYDRVFVYCSAMAQYAQFAGNAAIIVDLVDVDSDKWRQYGEFARGPISYVYRREGRALRAYEQAVCRRASAIIVTTAREAQLVREIDDKAPVHVIPNGVDTTYFSTEAFARTPTEPCIVFTGDMAYYPNEQAVVGFAKGALPVIRRAVPGVKFIIVGRRPGPAVRELARFPGIEVTGFVPDVRTYLARATVAVAPFQIAAGIQNKILEAMSFGLPVVATERAAQGLEAAVLPAVQVANNAEDLAFNCVRLLTNPAIAQLVGEDSRRRVSSAYNWHKSLKELVEIVELSDHTRRVASEAVT